MLASVQPVLNRSLWNSPAAVSMLWFSFALKEFRLVWTNVGLLICIGYYNNIEVASDVISCDKGTEAMQPLNLRLLLRPIAKPMAI